MAGPSLWLTTMGCAKNQVDSEKVAAMLSDVGYSWADSPERADVVMVNTCAFVEEARAESVGAIVELGDRKQPEAKAVVIGCMAQRFGAEVSDALPEVDAVVGIDRYDELVPVLDGLTGRRPAQTAPPPVLDILHAPGRPAPGLPYAYLKAAEGCGKPCTFCAIPSIRGPLRSRPPADVRSEAEQLAAAGAVELVLVAQDLGAYGRDIDALGGLVGLIGELSDTPGLARLRLLYLHPREIDDRLIEAMVADPQVASYFDLSLQHVSRPLLRAMRRPGGAEEHLTLVDRIRGLDPAAAVRSSFIVGFPGESEAHVDELEEFLEEARLDWAGFFPYSAEPGTRAAGMADHPSPEDKAERARRLTSVQDEVTEARNASLLGCHDRVIIDMVDDGAPIGRSHRHAPEVDGIVRVDRGEPGEWVDIEYTGVYGPDMEGAAL